MEKKKYKQIEIMPLPHGGKRENAGRKKIDEALKKPKTVAIRVDEKLLPEIEKLKNCKKIEEKTNNVEQIKEKLLLKIYELKKIRDETEKLENTRKGEDNGQFAKIIEMDIKLISLEEMVKKL